MQPDLQQWLEKSSSDQERPQLPPHTIKNTITVEAENHQHPVEATLDDDDGNNRNAWIKSIRNQILLKKKFIIVC